MFMWKIKCSPSWDANAGTLLIRQLPRCQGHTDSLGTWWSVLFLNLQRMYPWLVWGSLFFFLKHNMIVFEYTTKIQNTIVNWWKWNMVFHLHCMKIAKIPSYEFLETSNKVTDIPRKMKKKKKNRRKWNNKVTSKD